VRTNIDIDDELLAEAQKLAGTKTKKATVEYALNELIRRRRAKSIMELRGKVEMYSIDEIRGGRHE
jgi:Arc/MetJ family transcription regulator